MTTYIIRRLIAIPILLGITVLVFTFLAIAPGDPVSAFIRPELANNEAMRKVIIERYGLDQPIPVRYVRWLTEALQGNLGYAAVGGLPIADMLKRGLLASASLMLTALFIGIAIGIPLDHLGAAPVLEAGLRADGLRVPRGLDAVVPARPGSPVVLRSSSASSRSGDAGPQGAVQPAGLHRASRPSGDGPRRCLHRGVDALHARPCSRRSTSST